MACPPMLYNLYFLFYIIGNTKELTKYYWYCSIALLVFLLILTYF